MKVDTLQMSSTIAAWAQAAAALIGLIFIGWQIRLSRKTSDFQVLTELVDGFQRHEEALNSAQCAESKHRAFINFLNFLEFCTASSNDGLLHGTSKKIVDLKVRDSLAIIQASPDWHANLEVAISSPETFEEITKFYKANKDCINSLSAAHSKIDKSFSVD
jgi:hypothetical protein